MAVRLPYKLKALARVIQRVWGALYPEYILDRAFLKCLDYGKLNEELKSGRNRVKEAVFQFYRKKFSKECSFFFDENEQNDICEILGPTKRSELMAGADEILEQRLPLLGRSGVFCGSPLAWDRDPITQTQRSSSPFRNGFDPNIDWRYHCELHLHRHFCILARAYTVTRDKRYAEEIISQLESWLGTYGPDRDEDVTSALDCGIRIASWIWALHALAGFEGMRAELYWRVLKSVFLHVRFIERNLEPHGHANNHRIGEGWGLLTAGILFPEFRRAGHWRQLGLAVLVQEAEVQFKDDGGHREKAFNYHRMVMEYYCQAVILCRRNSIEVPQSLLRRLNSMFDFLLGVTRPDGRLPSMGDAGMPSMWPDSELEDVSRTAALGAALFKRGDLKVMVKRDHESIAWFLGPDGWRIFNSLNPTQPAFLSAMFPSSGIGVVRADWSSKADYLIFDCGEQGLSEKPGHSHADALSFELCVDGSPVVIDPGTYLYRGSMKWRNYFRGTSAHNTVLVDGIDQAVTGDKPFAWKTLANARCNHFQVDSGIAFLDGEHDGYKRLDCPVVHRRRLLAIPGKYYLIFDELIGAGSHDLDLLFHFVPGRLNRANDGWVLFESEGTNRLGMKILAENETDEKIVWGREEPVQGWYSRGYGLKEASPVLISSQKGRLPLFFGTLLVPRGTMSSDGTEFSRCFEEEGHRYFGSASNTVRFIVRHGNEEEYIVFPVTDQEGAFATSSSRRGGILVEHKVQGQLRKTWKLGTSV